MKLLSEKTGALPTCTLSEVEEALLKRIRDTPSKTESYFPLGKPEEERPWWWILSALDACEGREAHEAYYARL